MTTKTLTRVRWTAEEDSLIHASPGLTARQLSEKLVGRTWMAVERRRKVIGASAVINKDPNGVGARTLIAKTCLSCGRVMPGAMFRYRNGNSGRRVSNCRDCYNAYMQVLNSSAREGRSTDERKHSSQRSMDYARKLNAITELTARNAGEEYTDSDHKVLSNPHLSPFQKALLIGRTYNGIKAACCFYGYRSGQKLPYAVEFGRWIIENPNVEICAQEQATE